MSGGGGHHHATIDPGGLIVRLLLVETGTLATWNPSGYSLLGWLAMDDGWSFALKVAFLVFALVLAGWGVLTGLAALGRGGIAVAVVIAGGPDLDDRRSVSAGPPDDGAVLVAAASPSGCWPPEGSSGHRW